MNRLLLFLIPTLLLACTADVTEESTTGTIHSIEETGDHLMPKQNFDSLSIFTHKDSLLAIKGIIPFWKWGDYNPDWYWNEPGKTRLVFPGFRVKIDGKFETARRNDTLSLFEDVGWYFEGRTWFISADNKTDKFDISLAAMQYIYEQYDPKMNDDPTFDDEKWFANRYEAKELSTFYPIEDSSGYYRIPWVHTDGKYFEDKYIKKYKLDTSSHYIPGEMGGSRASMKVNGVNCCFYNEYGLIKITKTTAEGVKSDHYFKIEYSYGC